MFRGLGWQKNLFIHYQPNLSIYKIINRFDSFFLNEAFFSLYEIQLITLVLFIYFNFV